MSQCVSGARIRRGRSAVAVLALSLVVPFGGRAGAAEIILQNDSIPTPGAGAPLLAFVPNEIAAAWFTSPVAGDIVGVQILWDSMFGGNGASLELGIEVFSAGAFPTPGPSLATIPGPMLIDATPGANINEFRFLDPPTDAVPLQVPVIAGQVFAVGLEFLNQNAGNAFGSSVEIDGDGCQPGKNSVLAQPGGWAGLCVVGGTGDFGIRAIINPIPEPGVLAVMLVGACAIVGRRGRRAS